MTKKSHARNMRDQQAKDVRAAEAQIAEAKIEGWEELETIYNTAASQIFLANTHLARYTADKTLYPYIKDGGGFSNMVMAHAQDLLEFADNLKSIHEMHAGRTGVIKDIEEFKTIIHISELYDAFQSRYAGVIPQSATNIADILAEAINAKVAAEKAALEEAEAHDVRVVTDVEAKEEVAEPATQRTEEQV